LRLSVLARHSDHNARAKNQIFLHYAIIKLMNLWKSDGTLGKFFAHAGRYTQFLILSYSTLVKATDSSVTVPRHDIDDIISRVRTMKGRLTKRSQVKGQSWMHVNC